MSQTKNRRIIGILVQILSQILFGLSFLFTKEATETVTPLKLLSWRFLLAAVVFTILILAGFFKVDSRDKDLRPALLLGFLHPILYFLCENKGIALTSASESGTIIATIPIFSLLFSMLFLKFKPRHNQVIGIIITITGVLILVLSQGSRPTFSLPGYILLFGCVIAYSLFAVQSEKNTAFSSVEKAVIMVYSGAVFFTAANVISEVISGDLREFLRLPFTNRTFLIAILYLGIGSTIIAFTCNNYGIETLGMTAAASFAGLSTMITVIAGTVFLHEQVGAIQIAATVLVISGVFIANKSG